jgi:hypothetical protein
MRDFRDAKAMAHSLRDALKAKAVEISHGESLELIARSFGYENWNILSAKIGTAQPGAGGIAGPQRPAPEAVLYCSFCGKSQHHVNKLIAGPAVSICDECVDICTDIIDDSCSALSKAMSLQRGQCRPTGCCIMSSMRGKASNAIVSSCSASIECSSFGATQHRSTMTP